MAFAEKYVWIVITKICGSVYNSQQLIICRLINGVIWSKALHKQCTEGIGNAS